MVWCQTGQMAITKNLEITNAAMVVEKRGHSYVVSGSICWWSLNEEQYDCFIKKYRATIWSINLTPGHTSRQKYPSKTCMHPDVHRSTPNGSQDRETSCVPFDRSRRYSAHIHWSTTQPQQTI